MLGLICKRTLYGSLKRLYDSTHKPCSFLPPDNYRCWVMINPDLLPRTLSNFIYFTTGTIQWAVSLKLTSSSFHYVHGSSKPCCPLLFPLPSWAGGQQALRKRRTSWNDKNCCRVPSSLAIPSSILSVNYSKLPRSRRIWWGRIHWTTV